MKIRKRTKKFTYLLRGTSGLAVSFLSIRALMAIDGTAYENSDILFVILVTSAIVFFMYGLSQIISASETLSRLFIVAVVAKGAGPVSARIGYALNIHRKEKNHTHSTSTKLNLAILCTLAILILILLLVNQDFLVKNGGWFALGAILILFTYFIASGEPE